MAGCRCHSGQEMLFAKIIPVKFFIKKYFQSNFISYLCGNNKNTN